MKIIKGLPREAKPNELVALDVEMYQQPKPLHLPTGTFACLSIAFPNRGDQYMVTDPHDIGPALERIDKGLWTMHNALYDIGQMRRWAKIKERKIWDTMLVEQALYGGYFETYSLEALSLRYLSAQLDKETRFLFGEKSSMTKDMEQYAIKDARVTSMIAQKQMELVEDKDFKWYWDIDQRMIWTVLDLKPIKVDVDGWLEMVEGFEQIANDIQERLGFNVYSHKTVKQKIKEVTGRSVKSTDARDVLDPLMQDFIEKGQDKNADFIRTILDARMYRKATSTYGRNWVDNWVREGNLVYPGWRITGAETGRMACRDPNIQNIPARRLPQYRERFISAHDKGRMMIGDVSQQEVRINAYFSKDPALLEAFEKDADVHQWVADEVGCERRLGKALNLGMSYGMTEYGLARDTGMKTVAARSLLNKYFRKFRGVNSYINKQRSYGVRNEKVFTATGRPIYLNTYQRQWENNCVNGPIQGSAADQAKLALNFYRDMAEDFNATMIIHDEIVCDITDKKSQKALREAWIAAGEYVVPGVPMKVDITIGDNWGAKK